MGKNKFFIDNEVVKEIEGQSQYDKFAVASTVFDMSFKGSKCHLIEGHILDNCKGCNLEPICKGINILIQEYIKDTTEVTEAFSFN